MPDTDIFRPQNNVDISGNTIAPIEGRNFEIGLKGEYLDGALNASLALFRIDEANRARELADQGACPTFPNRSCYEAAGLVRSEGVDIELQGELAAGWQIGTGYTYSRTEYRKDANPDRIGTQYDTGVPEHLFKLNSTYRLPGKLDDWRIGANLSWQSETHYLIAPLTGSTQVRHQQDGYWLAGLIAEYAPGERFSLQANVNNLFDKTYYLAISDDVYWGATELYGAPRNFKLTMRLKY
ncbi:TonB-dependent receptor [Altericroceibacterium spongiae]|uniref:TonB-dependent receptor n=1 Tax=Altericroceibacterium spongiae TaxID=2320269 RepID=A0A420EAC2_9SPHN|nr:TonB-dependent receptor [Altericroceibacterium spongiae]RKF17615.1 TonB-dependent receptor [Altericroceibacterium spongiae]